MKTLPRLLIFALAGFALTACATKTAKNDDKDEYVYYTPTGSNIPVRVKKSDLQTPDSETQKTQEALRELQVRGAATHNKDN